MDDKLAPIFTDDVALRETVRSAVFPGSTDAEMAMFFHDCQRARVHPMDRLIHPRIYNADKPNKRRYSSITSIDLFRARSEEDGNAAGMDPTKFDGKPFATDFAATVTVYKLVGGQRCAYHATARWPEYYPGDGDGGAMWRKMPHVMLEKCAEALARRRAWPTKLHGLYTAEEMARADQDEQAASGGFLRARTDKAPKAIPVVASDTPAPWDEEPAAPASVEPGPSQAPVDGPFLTSDAQPPPKAQMSQPMSNEEINAVEAAKAIEIRWLAQCGHSREELDLTADLTAGPDGEPLWFLEKVGVGNWKFGSGDKAKSVSEAPWRWLAGATPESERMRWLIREGIEGNLEWLGKKKYSAGFIWKVLVSRTRARAILAWIRAENS